MSATAVTNAVGADGTFVRGTFRGVQKSQDGRFSHLVVSCSIVGRPEPFDRRLDFRAYDPSTGAPTPVGEVLQTLQDGDRVEVAVYLDALLSSRGKAFPKLSALAIRKV